MEPLKCICGKIHCLNASLINCPCGHGKDAAKLLNKVKIVKAKDSDKELQLTRKKLISKLKKKEIITDVDEISGISDDRLREMLAD